MKKISNKRKILFAFLTVACLIVSFTAFFMLNLYNLLPQKVYYAEDFGIETVKSDTDFNGNGIDDYTDILLGARKDAENKPTYNGKYFDNGYPPDDIGVCTDVIWRAFKNAGYSLRDMVDKDIIKRPEAYPRISTRDRNIDFRRVMNLESFFDEYAETLTIDTSEIAEWQPGDIIISNNGKHIGIVSDKRNADGKPFIIHNGGQPNREEDYLKRGTVYKHYRFDPKAIPDDILTAWED